MHPTPASFVRSPSSRGAPPRPPTPPRAPRDGSGENHHLWRNGRLWWIAVTLYDTVRVERVRVRRSLRTADVAVARRLRDAFLARARASSRFELAIRGPAAEAGSAAAIGAAATLVPRRGPVAAAG